RDIADRVVDDVVRVARPSGAIDKECQPVVLAECREGREPDGPFLSVTRDPPSGHDWRGEQTAGDRRHRRFLTNDAIAGGAEGFGRLWLPYGTPPRLCRARCHRRVLGDISIRADGVTRQTRVRLCECLCTLFDAERPSPSMKMRPMPRGRLITLVPFALVSALAVGVALAGYIASPHAPPTSARVGTSTPPPNPPPPAAAPPPTPDPPGPPTPRPPDPPPTPRRPTTAPDILQGHNALRP